MIRVCAWCESENRPALMGHVAPFDDDRETHGICPAHLEAMRVALKKERTA